ncbi:hypothetical protein CPter91_2528 [Collimonas pratensis]|uniref:Uncharacterized protein n=1 Tax=Collimonas pratensis TaxID=279113 RepID=A0A127Q5G9_9BURK|nr:hypothetical protein CPter91_2528 [Collimonas pratensis]
MVSASRLALRPAAVQCMNGAHHCLEQRQKKIFNYLFKK